jgi:O-antigen/teichoic acid export membrane protein
VAEPSGRHRLNHPAETEPRPDQIAANAVVAFVAQMVGYLLGLGASVAIARSLGPAGRGEFAVAVTAASLAVTLFHSGVELATSYFFAERKVALSALSGNAALTAGLLAIPAVGLLLAAYFAARSSTFAGVSVVTMVLAAATVPFSMHTLWINNLFMLAGRLRAYLLVSLIVDTMQPLCILVLSLNHVLTVTAAVTVFCLSTVIGWLLMVATGRKFAPITPPYDLRLFRAVWSYGVRLHAGYVAWFLLLRIDLLLVATWVGSSAAGIYAVATVFAELIWMLTSPLVMASLRSQMSGAAADAAELSFRVCRVNVLIATALGLGLSATLWILLPLLYGEQFAAAYPLTVVLVPGVIAMAGFRPLYNWLVRTTPPFRLSLVCVGALVLNLAVNAILLPTIGVMGASIASTVAYTALTLSTAEWAARRGGVRGRDAVAPTREDAMAVWRTARQLSRDARATLARLATSWRDG